MIHIAQKSRRNQGAIKSSINGLFKVLSHANSRVHHVNYRVHRSADVESRWRLRSASTAALVVPATAHSIQSATVRSRLLSLEPGTTSHHW